MPIQLDVGQEFVRLQDTYIFHMTRSKCRVQNLDFWQVSASPREVCNFLPRCTHKNIDSSSNSDPLDPQRLMGVQAMAMTRLRSHVCYSEAKITGHQGTEGPSCTNSHVVRDTCYIVNVLCI